MVDKINKEMLDALKLLHGKGGLGPNTHEWLRKLIDTVESNQTDNEEVTIQELSARDRLEEVTQSLRSLEATSLTYDQTKRVRAMVHYNELVLAGAKRSGVRRPAFIIGVAVGGSIAFTIGFIVGQIMG